MNNWYHPQGGKSDAKSMEDFWNRGNECAGQAAVQTRKTDLPEFEHLCQEVKEQSKHTPKLMHELACARMNLEEGAESSIRGPRATHTDPDQHLKEQIRKLATWNSPVPTYIPPGEPHQVVFRASTARSNFCTWPLRPIWRTRFGTDCNRVWNTASFSRIAVNSCPRRNF